MAQTHRTFIAVEIPGEVRAAATKLISQLRDTGADVRWVEPHNLHLTMKFLGAISTNDAAEVCLAVHEAVRSMPVFDIDIVGAGAFPTPARPRTVWMGVGEGTEEMIELHTRIQSALADFGFRQENRRFRPHITLGRVRHQTEETSPLAEYLQKVHEVEYGLMTVSEVVVFTSELTRNGPVYEPMGHLELQGGYADEC